MSASFHELGSLASWNEQLRISATGCANRSAFSLRSQPGTPSGPIALEEFKDNIFLKTDSSDTFKGHSSVIGRGKLSAAKGSKTFIGARKALLIVLAMSCKVGGFDWPQSMCWYSVAGSGQPDALDIPLSFLTSRHQVAGLDSLSCSTVDS